MFHKGKKTLFLLIPGVCFSLGIWQIRRLKWKQNLLTELERSFSSSPETISEFNPQKENSSSPKPFHRYRIKGKFCLGKEGKIALIGPRFMAKKPGYKLIVPFAMKENSLKDSSDSIQLVDIGWISSTNQSMEKILSSLSNDNSVECDVICLKEEKLGLLERFFLWMTMRQQRKTNFSFPRYMTGEIAKSLGIPTNCFMFQAFETNSFLPSGIYRSPSNNLSSIQNNHLEYAITWFSLGTVSILMYSWI